MPRAYAYLVISPNPKDGNSISTGKGVEIDNGGTPKLEYSNSAIHFIKVGHQKGLEGRFSDYNTHNPSIWFRHLMIEKPLNPATKAEDFEEIDMDDQTKANSSSANFIQKISLEQKKYAKAFRANEWFVVDKGIDSLGNLCDALDNHDGLKEMEIEKRNGDVIQGPVNIFNTEEDCIDFLGEHGKPLFAKLKT